MRKFAAYYAGVENGLTYAHAPHTITFENLGKSHLHATTLEAATPDDAFEQLQVLTMSVATAASIPDYLCRLSMIPGDALLEEDGALHTRTPQGKWITRPADH